uniref:Uncharacterized protein n=1 Tax=Cucumis melo TaxID=3656 RepID=A0A9I9E8J9_CUCME
MNSRCEFSKIYTAFMATDDGKEVKGNRPTSSLAMGSYKILDKCLKIGSKLSSLKSSQNFLGFCRIVPNYTQSLGVM